MSNEEVGLRLESALNYARIGNDEELRPHFLWQIDQLTNEISAEDLTTLELVALITVLIPAHSRILTGRRAAAEPQIPFLRLIPDPSA